MFQFPLNPIVGQSFTPLAGVTYKWNGTAWYLVAGPGAFITQGEADLRYVNVDEVPSMGNRIINGKFAIDQRNAGALLLSTGNPFAMDRWRMIGNGAGTFGFRQLGDPTSAGEFVGLFSVASAAASLGAADVYAVWHVIEGVNVSDLRWGTSPASPVTIAFEVEATIAGTITLAVLNGGSTRSYVTPITIAAPNARQLVSVTIPPDTIGVWPKDNTAGMRIALCFGGGSDCIAPAANTWSAGSFFSVSGATNFMAAACNVYVKNFRLYKGSVDFGPDRRLYAEELALCQRYYEKNIPLGAVFSTGGSAGSVGGRYTATGASEVGYVSFQTTKRTVPTVTGYSPSSGLAGFWLDNSASLDRAFSVLNPGESGFTFSIATATATNIYSGNWSASAEL